MTSLQKSRFAGTTSSRGTQVAGIISILGFAMVTFLGLYATGADVDQRNNYRIIYVHVPQIQVGMLLMAIPGLNHGHGGVGTHLPPPHLPHRQIPDSRCFLALCPAPLARVAIDACAAS